MGMYVNNGMHMAYASKLFHIIASYESQFGVDLWTWPKKCVQYLWKFLNPPHSVPLSYYE